MLQDLPVPMSAHWITVDIVSLYIFRITLYTVFFLKATV